MTRSRTSNLLLLIQNFTQQLVRKDIAHILNLNFRFVVRWIAGLCKPLSFRADSKRVPVHASDVLKPDGTLAGGPAVLLRLAIHKGWPAVVLGHACVEVLVDAVQNREPAQAERTALRVAEPLELDEQLPQVVDDLFFIRLRLREAGNLGAQTDTTHTHSHTLTQNIPLAHPLACPSGSLGVSYPGSIVIAPVSAMLQRAFSTKNTP